MTRRAAIAICCFGLLSVPAFAADEAQEPSCCVRKSSEKKTKMRCSLTGKEVEECCCEKTANGKYHCTLADKDVETCCCTEAETKTRN